MKQCKWCGTKENVAEGKNQDECFDCWEEIQVMTAEAREEFFGVPAPKQCVGADGSTA